MIEIKDAIKIGKDFLLEIYEKTPEEVVLNSVGSFENMWLVTFRVYLNVKPINSLQNILGVNNRIFYKTVKIGEDGNVVGFIDEDLPTGQSSEIQPQAA
jgi:hypothetical protein